ncbi:MAG TPA: M15 family metallopeptidase [Anaerovoracaceae bacterium]|nr:M15 family metallopeptidase [Anaerovoracaceae bacterium]
MTKAYKNRFIALGMAFLSLVLLTGCLEEEVANEKEVKPTQEEETIKIERDDPYLILINKENALPSNYVPDSLMPIDGNLSSNQGISADARTLQAYLDMREAALEEDVHMVICSAYRSYGLQEVIYNRYLSSRGEEWTKEHSAYPGTSEHQTGLAIDITSAEMGYGLDVSFEDTKEGIWLREHCAEYGFIIRYLEGKKDITGYTYEPWHIRYVGKEYSEYIMNEGLTLEEFFQKSSEE